MPKIKVYVRDTPKTPSTRNSTPRITSPNPFHLDTEERGAEKKKKFKNWKRKQHGFQRLTQSPAPSTISWYKSVYFGGS
ncbi:hypothetical protein MTR_5g459320 [Medicago truncatula]|uniref:Uncharacterized protein n=1 Tax=Medicago truncatula TaxID=3880 RepID=A0A072UF07_MEDTR|nr:hypothetical protein MTR_5g459320 [Medicago truncatula]